MSESSLNVNNIPNVQWNPMGVQGNLAMQGMPAMQGVPQGVGDTELGNRVKNSSEMTQSPYTLPVAAGSWFAISQGMDLFSKKCNGTYDESILGKITGAADKLSDKITNSSLAKSNIMQWVGKKCKSFTKYLNDKSLDPKNRVLYGLRNLKTKPECGFVKTAKAGLDGFLVSDTRQIMEEFFKPTKEAVQLKQYGASQELIEEIAKLPKAERLARIQDFEVKHYNIKDIAGKSNDEIQSLIKECKIKDAGFASEKHFTKIMKDDYALEHMDEITDVLKKGNKNLKISIWKKDGFMGKVFGFLLGREVGIQELYNKFLLTTKKGAKTTFGKLTGKSFGYLTEGGTSRFAGGKLAVAMQAFIIADMLIHTFKAPKGEKGKTLAERSVNDFSFFLAMPLGIWAMHKVAGFMKYFGMSKAQVEAYRANLQHFNANASSYGKKMYNLRKEVLDRQLTAGIKNPIIKLFKKASCFLTVGLERVKPYVSKDSMNLNLLRKSKYWGKNALGYGIRFAIPMFLFSPFIAKNTTKIAHAIFGKPTHSVLDEDKEQAEAEKAEKQAEAMKAAALAQAQAQSQSGQVTQTNKPVTPKNPSDYKSDTNLIKMTANGQNIPNTISQATINETQGQSQTVNNGQTTATSVNTATQTNNQNNAGKEMEPLRTYIPSPVGMVGTAETDGDIDAACRGADQAEKQIQDVLSIT